MIALQRRSGRRFGGDRGDGRRVAGFIYLWGFMGLYVHRNGRGIIPEHRMAGFGLRFTRADISYSGGWGVLSGEMWARWRFDMGSEIFFLHSCRL